MALINGDDFIEGSIGSYQQWNRIKNHWRGSSPPSDIQEGMLFSDADDDKLYHAIAGSGWPLEEILQETLSFDKSPIFDNIYLDVDSAALSDPPTETELIAVFGASPGDGFCGRVKNSLSGGKYYIVHFYGGIFYYVAMVAAV